MAMPTDKIQEEAQAAHKPVADAHIREVLMGQKLAYLLIIGTCFGEGTTLWVRVDMKRQGKPEAHVNCDPLGLLVKGDDDKVELQRLSAFMLPKPNQQPYDVARGIGEGGNDLVLLPKSPAAGRPLLTYLVKGGARFLQQAIDVGVSPILEPVPKPVVDAPKKDEEAKPKPLVGVEVPLPSAEEKAKAEADEKAKLEAEAKKEGEQKP